MDTLDMRRAGDRREALAEERADASAVLGLAGYTAWQEGEYEHDLSADAGQHPERDFELVLAAEAPERDFYLLQAELRSAQVEYREARAARAAEEAAIEVLELVRCPAPFPACCVALRVRSLDVVLRVRFLVLTILCRRPRFGSKTLRTPSWVPRAVGSRGRTASSVAVRATSRLALRRSVPRPASARLVLLAGVGRGADSAGRSWTARSGGASESARHVATHKWLQGGRATMTGSGKDDRTGGSMDDRGHCPRPGVLCAWLDDVWRAWRGRRLWGGVCCGVAVLWCCAVLVPLLCCVVVLCSCVVLWCCTVLMCRVVLWCCAAALCFVGLCCAVVSCFVVVRVLCWLSCSVCVCVFVRACVFAIPFGCVRCCACLL